MKKCPECGWDVNDVVTACPRCGGSWDAAGRLTPPADADAASARPRAPEAVDDKTPEQPKPSSIFSGFWGLHLAGIGLILIVWVLAWILNGD